MRVLIVRKLKRFSGGIDRSLLKQIPYLQAAGLDVAVLVASSGYFAAEVKNVKVFSPKKDLLDIRGSDNKEWSKVILETVEQYQPDILYPHQLDTIVSTLSAGSSVPVVGSLHSGLFDWISDKDKRELQDALPRLASLHAVGYNLSEQLRSLGAKNIVNVFSPAEKIKVKARPRVSPQDPRIIFIGRADTRKGLDTLLESFALLLKTSPGAQLTVIGQDGETEREYGGGIDRPLARELGIDKSVSWLGVQPYQAVLEKIGESDLLVSSSRFEALPGVILEAHSAALPVVATSACAEAMRWGEAGLVVPKENPYLLSRAILADLDDPYRQERALENRKWVLSNYSMERLVKTIVDDFSVAAGS